MSNPAPHKRPCYVLYIEDNPGEARLLTEALNNSGLAFKITVLKDGEEAVAFFHSKNVLPDVVVLDLELPKIHGIEVLQTIKADPDLTSMRILVFADARSPHMEKLKQIGVDLLLSKPLVLDGYDHVVAAIFDLFCTS